jgi:methylenetetrahydrofolate dehydrogenase (NADP+) / methenyltetrahydrofolate cyclohydrolase
MQRLDGNIVSQAIKADIKTVVTQLRESGKRPPHLVAILVGDNPASQAYVNSKVKTCAELGFASTLIRRESTMSEAELLEMVRGYNNDSSVDGILVQLPLPKHILESRVIEAISPQKDVDGFHPVNQGNMMLGLPGFIPATPYGVLLMLEHYGIKTAGMHAIVIGRSNIVGTPMSVLLSRNSDTGNCTVTLCHSHTKNLRELCLQADIIVAAIGKPHFVTADMVKQGAVVIDVGINRVQDATLPKGYRLVGDVHFDEVASKAGAITPVPGGVGVMTICALMKNTLKAYAGVLN